MNSVRVKAYAKINLTLDVLGVSGGFHGLDSLVASIDIYDLISAKKRRDGVISLDMHDDGTEYIPPERNNAFIAAERFAKAYGTGGAHITVWKNIPYGAGLGGSSADAAGVLNAMAKLYGIDDAEGLKRIADGIGSDCGYMLTGGYARLGGRGERVCPVDCRLKLYIGLLVPDGGVSTAECYALSDRLGGSSPHTTSSAVEAAESGDAALLGKCLSNGLAEAAKALNPDVAECIDELSAFDPLGVNMTGSGSGVYAIFENDQFLRYAKSRYRGKHRFIMTATRN